MSAMVWGGRGCGRGGGGGGGGRGGGGGAARAGAPRPPGGPAGGAPPAELARVRPRAGDVAAREDQRQAQPARRRRVAACDPAAAEDHPGHGLYSIVMMTSERSVERRPTCVEWR